MSAERFHFSQFEEKPLLVWVNDTLAFINDTIYFIVVKVDEVLQELEKYES